MAIWVIPVIIVGAVAAGLIAGLIIGKSQVKRSKPGYKPLLSKKEKIVYSALFAGGTALVLMGFFMKFPSPGAQQNDIMAFDQPSGEVTTGNVESNANVAVAVAVKG